MDFKKVNLVYFSTTNVSKKYAVAMGKALEKEVVTYDFTLPSDRDASKAPCFKSDDLVIVSVPVYGGRLPTVCLEYLNALKGEKTPCVIIATYGNRHYDDALVELEDIMSENGFAVVGACAVVGRHSFSDEIAGHRPNVEDLEGAAEFIKLVVAKEGKPLSKGTVPGNRPYKGKGASSGITPSTGDACIDCKLCAKKCPVGAINMENVKDIDGSKCLRCNRCVTICPTKAKAFTAPQYVQMVTNCIAGFGKPDRENVYFM
ncbi:MAG: 4Fe-4S binding protein [Oscillospiraceae bacterium]